MSQYASNKQWRDTGQHPESNQTLTTSPSSKAIKIGSLPPFRLPRRYARLALGAIIALSLFYVSEIHMSPYRDSPSLDNLLLGQYPDVKDTPPGGDESGLPPLYEEFRRYENHLSEQRLANDSRYIFFANHAHGSGWGNVLQEMVFSAMLASEAKLGYVWDDYTWDRKAENYSTFNGKTVAARIPLSTMLSGHVLGFGVPTNESDPARAVPLSISSRVYQQICPDQDRIIIERQTIQSYLDGGDTRIALSSATGKEVLDAWLAVLGTPMYKNARCIEVNRNASDHVFDIWLLGSPRMHSLWGTLSHSPVLVNWAWSPLIKRSFLKNVQYFTAARDLENPSEGGFFSRWWNFFFNQPRSSSEGTTKVVPIRQARTALMNDTQPLPILVLHLRRGDFKEHCGNLAGWSSTYTGFNSFPESRFRDSFNVPKVVKNGPSRHVEPVYLEDGQNGDPREVHSMHQKKGVYARHCFPDAQQIVKRVKQVVREYVIFAEERERREELIRSTKTRGSHWWNRYSITKYQPEGIDHDEQIMIKDVPRSPFAGNRHLKKIYIMTNGEREWLEDVKKRLKNDAQSWGFDALDQGWTWEGIATSRDLELGWEENPVAQALDMYVAQRAEVFIGNGFDVEYRNAAHEDGFRCRSNTILVVDVFQKNQGIKVKSNRGQKFIAEFGLTGGLNQEPTDGRTRIICDAPYIVSEDA